MTPSLISRGQGLRSASHQSQGDVLELSQAPIEDRFAGDVQKPAEDHAPRRLGDVLVGRAVVTGEQLGEALVAQTATGRRLGEVMVELGLLSQTDLAEALAEQLGLPSIALARHRPQHRHHGLVAEATARELCAIPVQRDGDRVVVAVGDPRTCHCPADRRPEQYGGRHATRSSTP